MTVKRMGPGDHPSLFDSVPEVKELYAPQEIAKPAAEQSLIINLGHVARESDRLGLLREMYDFSSIYFIPTEVSLIANPEDFLERVGVIQNIVFGPKNRLTFVQNANALKNIVNLGLEIENVSDQKKAVDAKDSTIKYADEFIQSRKAINDNLMMHRRQIYDDLGFWRMVELGIITEDNLNELYDADLIVLFERLRGKSRDNADTIDRDRLEEYKLAIDQYVFLNEYF